MVHLVFRFFKNRRAILEVIAYMLNSLFLCFAGPATENAFQCVVIDGQRFCVGFPRLREIPDVRLILYSMFFTEMPSWMISSKERSLFLVHLDALVMVVSG